MKLIKNNVLLILILIIAIFIRGYKLDNLPSLNPDEAALGYNAYSLIKTGKDEHGVSWPLHFKSFGDYKPGGYVYFSMPFIYTLGLTSLAIRLPNLILSVLTIFILYKLVFLLSSSKALSLFSAMALSLSPWHIHFSRGAWESSSALFFIIIGIYWFYSFLANHKSYYLYLTSISLAFSLYIYHSARIIAPILILILFIINFKKVIIRLKPLFFAISIGILFSIPVFLSFISNGGATRFGGVGLTADYGPLARAEELLNHHANTKLFNRVIHNRRLLYIISWAQKYTSHFDPNFLFIEGDSVPRSKSPDMGQLYLVELPLIILGITFLLKHYSTNALTLLCLSWLFVSPIASSLTFQAPSALRSLPITIPLAILTGIGLFTLLKSSSKYFPHNIFFLTVIIVFSIFYYFDAYFIHSPKRFPFAWNSGFESIIPFLEKNKANFDNIYFTDKYDQPYILYLFFTQYPPQKIQSQIKLTPPDKFGFSTVNNIDNIHFGKIDWSNIPQKSLVFAADEVVPQIPDINLFFSNQEIAFKIYTK